MSNNDVVSVIVPTYNVEKYIERCVRSITGQTYQKIEIIIIDDGSSDNTYAICKRLSLEDSRIRLFSMYKNVGVSGARNYGLQQSTGEYICFVDGDDWIEACMVEEAVSRMKPGIDIIYYCYVGNRVIDKERLYERDEALIHFLNLKYLGGYCCDKLYRASCIGDIRFREDMHIGEDGVFSLEAIMNAHNVFYMGKQLYHYEQRPNSSSEKNTFSIRQFDCFKQIHYCEQLVKNECETVREHFACFCITLCYSLLLKMLRTGAKDQYEKQYRYLLDIVDDYLDLTYKNCINKKLRWKCRILYIHKCFPKATELLIIFLYKLDHKKERVL